MRCARGRFRVDGVAVASTASPSTTITAPAP
jgi:hypothetical protein